MAPEKLIGWELVFELAQRLADHQAATVFLVEYAVGAIGFYAGNFIVSDDLKAFLSGDQQYFSFVG